LAAIVHGGTVARSTPPRKPVRTVFFRDGFDDLIVGCPIDNSGLGTAFVVFGKASGFVNVNLTPLDGTNGGFKVTTHVATSFGHSVSSAGDMNGDGFDGILVGARGGINAPGNAFVLFGRAGSPTSTLG
jgi:hypothetical protein